MSKPITILDKDYIQWVNELSSRYRQSQIKAAVKVNQEMLRFYWSLGRDIVEMRIEERWGEKVIKSLSMDLQREIPDAAGFSRTNLYYMKKFYLLYLPFQNVIPQIVPQSVEQIDVDIFSIPWGHHRYIIDKFFEFPEKALFFVRQTIQNGWSRDILLSFLDTDLYERSAKALTNFKQTLPKETSDLAQEITKDPYNFAFTGITGRYNEKVLKDALLENISQFLIELGTGFAYVGKEYRLQIDEKEKFIDLLFYNLKLSCYVVIEVKIGEFDFSDAGQLGGYVVACNHLLRKEGRDNPTIGLLVCKQKNNLLAQYALESSSQPLGISEYELAKLYPENVEGTIPTIEEIETKLGEKTK
ncbi:PDDEXK nuclease domain-containing protein [Odoribacter lunatus]|uniref:PDDEXK nuclease domain-containing protein n=1 Tax=Odoribacter lunatus TaxID=2941335 RepID=UPI00203EBDF8|nr:PDDEXK nuclease domain-containing protein [Odoribacter lunatus]